MKLEEKQKKQVINALKKILDLSDNPIQPSKAINQEIYVVDPLNICGIEAKSKEAKKVLCKFVSEENKNVLDINYSDQKGEIAQSKYSTEYFKKIINLIYLSDVQGRFKIKIGLDYPATIENKHFKVLLAPVVDMIKMTTPNVKCVVCGYEGECNLEVWGGLCQECAEKIIKLKNKLNNILSIDKSKDKKLIEFIKGCDR